MLRNKEEAGAQTSVGVKEGFQLGAGGWGWRYFRYQELQEQSLGGKEHGMVEWGTSQWWRTGT